MKLSIEETEVDKYLDKQDQAKQSGEYDLLYHSIETEEDIKEEQSEDQAIVDESNPNEAEYQVANEDFSLSSTVDFFRDALATLANIGIHYTPIILSKMYKGVIYGIVKLVKGLVNTSESVADYYIKHKHSFSSLLEDIEALKKSLSLVNDIDNLGNFTNIKIINSLKINDSIDVKANISLLEETLDTLVKHLNTSINDDLGYIKLLIASVTSKSTKTPTHVMESIPLKNYLIEGSIEGYEEESESIVSYHYEKILPGNIAIVSNLPSISNNDNIDSIAKAYNQSSLYLAFDRTNYKEIESIAYQSKSELSDLLDALTSICHLANEQALYYEQIRSKQKSLKYLFRLYISAITSSGSKMNTSVTLIDFINLKSSFINRIYIPFSMDFHSYTIKVIRSALQYCEENIKQFS